MLLLLYKTFSRKFLQFYSESDQVFQTGQPGLDPRLTRIFRAGELSKDCHNSLNVKEGVSFFPFDYTMCKFITDLFFTIVGLVLTIYLRAKQIIYFRNDTEKKCLNYYVLF